MPGEEAVVPVPATAGVAQAVVTSTLMVPPNARITAGTEAQEETAPPNAHAPVNVFLLMFSFLNVLKRFFLVGTANFVWMQPGLFV